MRGRYVRDDTRYRMIRTTLADGCYFFRLVDTHNDNKEIWSCGSSSPIAPSYLRKIQARYNSRHTLDKLHVY